MWINSSITTAQNAELACLDRLGEHWQSTLKTTLYFTKKESHWQMAKTPGAEAHYGKPTLLSEFSPLQ